MQNVPIVRAPFNNQQSTFIIRVSDDTGYRDGNWTARNRNDADCVGADAGAKPGHRAGRERLSSDDADS